MISTLSLVLSVTLAVASAAPIAASQDGAPVKASDLVIVGSSFGRVVKKTVIDVGGSAPKDRFGRTRARAPGMPPPMIILQREAYVQVHNVGNRRVESVDWSVVFYSDASREKVVERFAFHSKESIRPGEMKFLSESVKAPAPTAFETVSIERLEFQDGTSSAP